MLVLNIARPLSFPTLNIVVQYVDLPIYKNWTSCRKDAARMIFDLPTQTPTKLLLEKLNWVSVIDRFEYRRATMVHKSLNRTAPDYMKEMFKFVTDVSKRQTRFLDNSKLYLPIGSHLKVLQIVFNMQLVLSGTNCQCTFEKQKALQLFSQPI